MLTIEDLEERTGEITERLDEIFHEIQGSSSYTLTFERAAEVINLLMEAKRLSKTINYHEILTTRHCSGPH
jgi:hypothetical protein